MKTEYYIDSEHISVKASTVVKMEEHFTLLTLEGPVTFKTNITADLVEIGRAHV